MLRRTRSVLQNPRMFGSQLDLSLSVNSETLDHLHPLSLSFLVHRGQLPKLQLGCDELCCSIESGSKFMLCSEELWSPTTLTLTLSHCLSSLPIDILFESKNGIDGKGKVTIFVGGKEKEKNLAIHSSALTSNTVFVFEWSGRSRIA